VSIAGESPPNWQKLRSEGQWTLPIGGGDSVGVPIGTQTGETPTCRAYVECGQTRGEGTWSARAQDHLSMHGEAGRRAVWESGRCSSRQQFEQRGKKQNADQGVGERRISP